ncbi:MAG: histidinol-phosphate transaminase [Peptococcaceae bacterium]|nr:histidinol-phosphate transaminase [Peptococcaceae bacterium]
MSQYISRLARAIKPYVPGEQPRTERLIKLNTNENPYPPSPGVRRALQNYPYESLRLYPDPESRDLRQALARRHGVDPERIFVSNGSDELLALAFLAFFDPDREFRFPDITYSFYPVYADLFRMRAARVPLRGDFTLAAEGFYDSPGGVIFPNPNAPTGIAADLETVASICRHNAGAVIVDEAYAEFGGESAVGLLERFPHLLVVKTFSKSHALAGLRVGYALGSGEMIQALNRIKNSFNSYPLDRLAQLAAVASIEDEDYCRAMIRRVVATRERIIPELAALGFHCPVSAANFVFAGHERIPGERLADLLRERGVLVRYWKAPRIENYLRITVGTDAEMDALTGALALITG